MPNKFQLKPDERMTCPTGRFQLSSSSILISHTRIRMEGVLFIFQYFLYENFIFDCLLLFFSTLKNSFSETPDLIRSIFQSAVENSQN